MNGDREIHFYHLFTVTFEKHFPSRNSESTIRNVDSQCLNFMWSRGIELIITMCLYFFFWYFNLFFLSFHSISFNLLYMCVCFSFNFIFYVHIHALSQCCANRKWVSSHTCARTTISAKIFIFNQPIRICYKSIMLNALQWFQCYSFVHH